MSATAHPAVTVILSGGPTGHLPEAQRIREVGPDDTVLKVAEGRHYDHYHAVDERHEVDGTLVRVFRWLYRTYVAE
ncbi:DUF5988 family protein [Micromonospora matsumotoense]|uniref:DUF5988 family protein n=1 Tax=Micromonospora matsumotoense TaxID=121616 RepID=UPI00343C6246